MRLDRHCLQGLDAGDAFDQESLVLRAALELLIEAAAEQRRRAGRDRDVEREGGEHHPGEKRRVAEHHGQEHEGEEQVDDQGERRAGEEAADVLQLAHAGHRIAGAPYLEVADGKRHEMAEQASAELDVDAVGSVGKYVGPESAECRLE